MIRIGIIGDIGSGKTFVANNFGYPVFNADYEVSKLYKKDKRVFAKLNNLFCNLVCFLKVKEYLKLQFFFYYS